jgi:PadR family transcriptional regulator, regulatory protein PadR
MCSLGDVKLTGPLERVLRVLLADPAAPHYGYDLMKAARLPSGTLYPMLARLQQEGLVDSEWEDQRPDAGGRPPRKYYRLTAEGVRAARLELANASPAPSGTRRVAPRPAHGTPGSAL